MTFLERLCVPWLRDRNWLVCRTAPDAAGLLCERDYTVFAPGVPPVVPLIRAQELLAAADYTILPPGVLPVVSLDRAKEVLHAADYSVFAPEVPPAIGAWVPEYADAYPTRFVSGVAGDTVTYDCMGATHTCKVKTFHIWRRQRHAKLHDMQAKVRDAP